MGRTLASIAKSTLTTEMDNLQIDLHQEEKEGLREQLHVVFNACDPNGCGLISLEDLRKIGSSLVGEDHIEEVVQIFDPHDTSQDGINFEQFFDKFVQFMYNDEKAVHCDEIASKENVQNMTYLNVSPRMEREGTFNENLRRSFGRELIPSPGERLGGKNENMRRKITQSKLPGRIPLVNTSSEDEDDSHVSNFQRQYLVRGSSARNSIRRSNRQLNASTRSTPTRRTSDGTLGSKITITEPSDQSNCMTEDNKSMNTGKSDLVDLKAEENDIGNKMIVVDETASSGIGSLRADLDDDENNSSIQFGKRFSEESLVVERQKYAENLAQIEKERNAEKQNFQLKMKEFQKENNELQKKIRELYEDLGRSTVEKESMKEQLEQLLEKDDEEQVAFSDKQDDKEEALLGAIQCLTVRLQNQDQELAEVKEDNIILRSQIRNLKMKKEKDEKSGGRFRLFGGSKEENNSIEQLEDPQDIRVKLKRAEQELVEQKEVNSQLKLYVGEVLIDIMQKNPHVLEKG